jgi:transposase-like protein/IS1 family transposase
MPYSFRSKGIFAVARLNQMTIPQFEKMFPDEDACAAYLVARRWPDGVNCPRCGSVKVYKLATMEWKWECMNCGVSTSYRFSHIAGTIFENTNKPLRDWFRVIHLMMTSKKGISALQIQRIMGFGSYKTAHYMCHRVRAGLMDEDFRQLIGIVEVDETLVGGDIGNKHVSVRKALRKSGKGASGRSTQVNKTIVVGAVQRGGGVVARVIQKASKEVLESFVKEACSNKVSMICTDQYPGYFDLARRGYFHRTVDHGRQQYVVGAVHTQTIEGFWSILKRGVVGTYHKVSAKYLPLYVAEFQFRYNNRNNSDIFGAAVSAC